MGTARSLGRGVPVGSEVLVLATNPCVGSEDQHPYLGMLEATHRHHHHGVHYSLCGHPFFSPLPDMQHARRD